MSKGLKINKDIEKALTELLLSYGIDNPSELFNNYTIDVHSVINALSDNLGDDTNRLKVELIKFRKALPPQVSRRPILMRIERFYDLVIERLELLEGLSRAVVHICTGSECPYFSVCPFADVVEQYRVEDRVLCAVERQIVDTYVEGFVTPPDGSKGVIDVRRPEVMLLFHQLVQLIIRQNRISMQMQIDNVMRDHYEILRKGPDDQFDTGNQMVHPLMDQWDKTTAAIQKIMRDLGLTPEFQIKHGLYQDPEEKIALQDRIKVLAKELLRDGFQKTLSQLPEGHPERALLVKMIGNAVGDSAALGVEK